MAQYFNIHPDNPQQRLLSEAAAIIRRGGIVIYPTDSCYALGCSLEHKTSIDQIRRIRNLSVNHLMTLVCRDLSEISNYAYVDNKAFRLMKSLTPGPYTFVCKAKRDVPRRLQHPKRKTIGIRIPDNTIALSLLDCLGEPILSTSLILPDADWAESEPDEIEEKLGNRVDLIIDGGACSIESTTMIDLDETEPVVIRQGKGKVNLLETI